MLKIIHVAVENTADELSELNVTHEAVDELDELVVDDKAKLMVALLECQCINQLCWAFEVAKQQKTWSFNNKL